MGKILICAEKPSVGNDIAKALGVTDKKHGYIENDRYIVTWAIGHLIGLKQPHEHDAKYKSWNLDTLPIAFPIDSSLKVLPDTSQQFNVIKALINRSDVELVVNAGDAGREGLLIQEWIYRMCANRKPIKMLWISSFTEQAVRNAFDGNLKNRHDFISLLNEAEARAEGDYIMGMNYSRLLTLTRGGSGTVLAYGRCQTPLLNLIVEREKEITTFVSEPYYNCEVTYQQGFSGILVNQDKKRIDFKNRAEAEKIIFSLTEDSQVVSVDKADKKAEPPLLHNLASLQKKMGSRYGFEADYTLKLAQELYEKKKILSYPRTDSRYLSTDLFSEIGQILSCCNFGRYVRYVPAILEQQISINKRYFNDLKVTDHHALIPTLNGALPEIYSTLSEDERKLMDEVISSFVAIFMSDYRYSTTEMITQNNGSYFLSKGISVIELGYKNILSDDVKDDQEEDKIQNLPILVQGSSLKISEKNVIDKKTKAPSRYTVSSLIALMEKYNIGTSATRAEIINKLMNPKRQMMILEKKHYKPTAFGMEYISVVPDELKDCQLTQNFEKQLQQINEGTLSKEEFLNRLIKEIKDYIGIFTQSNDANKISNMVTGSSDSKQLICPRCGKKIYSSDKSYYCSGYKEGCRFTIWKIISGKKITESVVYQICSKGKSNLIKGFKSKAGKEYNAYLQLKEDKTGVDIAFK